MTETVPFTIFSATSQELMPEGRTTDINSLIKMEQALPTAPPESGDLIKPYYLS
jgi:hypothetical protein